MRHTGRLQVIFDLLLVALYALFLWGPWNRLPGSAAGGSPLTLLWLALPGRLLRHGASLQFATDMVTVCAIAAVIVSALLAVAARIRGSAALSAIAAVLFGWGVAILMPLWTAVGFLGALLLIVTLRARFVPLPRTTAVAAVLYELWPAGYAIGFAVLAWRYNPQLLLKTLIITLGLGLIGRALAPAHGDVAPG